MKRQNIRKCTLLFALLLFPISIWYFSPYLIIQAAFAHIVNGSCIVFALMFGFSLFLGRTWCGFFCPTGGLQECAFLVNDRAPKQGWRNYVKYGIWAMWLLCIGASWFFGHGKVKADFLYMTDHGISVSGIFNYIIYYGVVLLIFIPAICCGKRTACHYFCWMAPFMVIGSKLGRKLHLPQLHIAADTSRCVSCKTCNISCPMGLDVSALGKSGNITNSECILCGACVDACPNSVLRYKMKH